MEIAIKFIVHYLDEVLYFFLDFECDLDLDDSSLDDSPLDDEEEDDSDFFLCLSTFLSFERS